eukprot:Selendium_serpulae@DN3510_c0_g1_i2.p1
MGGTSEELITPAVAHNTIRPPEVRRSRTTHEHVSRHEPPFVHKRMVAHRYAPPVGFESTPEDRLDVNIQMPSQSRSHRQRMHGMPQHQRMHSAQYGNNGYRQNGQPNIKRQGLHQPWRSATESRVPDQQKPELSFQHMNPRPQIVEHDQVGWNMLDSVGFNYGRHQQASLENSIVSDFSAQRSFRQRGFVPGERWPLATSSNANPKRRAAASAKKGVSLVRSSSPDNILGPLDSARQQGRAHHSSEARHWQKRRGGGIAGMKHDNQATVRRDQKPPMEPNQAPTIRRARVPKLRTSEAEDKSFFRTVSFGHTDRDFFATSQVGCFYEGINRELERILLELSEECRKSKSPQKLVRLPEEKDESWASRNIPSPKTVVLGPAHQFYCYLRGKDLAQTFEDKAFYRCNSGSTSLLDQIQRNPLAIEFLAFGFKPDSYFFLTANEMFHNRLPLDMVQTIESEEMDVEAVQLWKGDGWFIKDSKSDIYFNNVQDMTLQIIFEKHHPLDPVEHFSISLNGLNWYVRTASGAEFYKSQVLQNIQKKHDNQFSEAASFFRPQSGS